MKQDNGNHAQEPWTVDTVSFAPPLVVQGDLVIAEVSGELDLPAGEDIARLIAAAPELLEALRLCVASGGLQGSNLTNALAHARAAIAKAKGDCAMRLNKVTVNHIHRTIAERDRLKTINAEMVEFVEAIFADTTPGPHPRIFNTPEEIREAARAVLAKARE